MEQFDGTKFEFDPAVLDTLSPDQRRQAIRALGDMAGGVKRNPLYAFDPMDPKGDGVPHLPQHFWLLRWQTPDGRVVKFRLMPGGNRGGKTTSGDVSVIIDSCERSAIPPHLQKYKRWDCRTDFFIVAVSGRAVEKIHLPIFRRWCPKDQLVGGSVDKAFSKEYQTLHFVDGSTVQFMTQGMDVEVFQGVPLHGVLFDEEPLYDHGLEIFTECMQRLVDYNGDVRMTFTPLNGMTWVYDKLWLPWAQQQPDREAATSGFSKIEWNGFEFVTFCQLVAQNDNPVIDDEGKAAAMAMARSDEEREARSTGRFVSFAGKIFADFARSRHVVPDDEVLERMHGRDKLMTIGALDPGFRHMAGVLWLTLDEDGVWVFPELPLEQTIIPQVVQEIILCEGLHGLSRVPFVADPAIAKIDAQTGLTDQQAYAVAGLSTRAANNDVRASINAIRSLLAGNRLHIAAGCDVLIDQIGRYRWKKTGRSENAAPEAPVKRDDHLIDPLRYGVMTLPIPESAAPVDRRSTRQRALDADMQRNLARAKEQTGGPVGPGQFS